MGNPVIHFEIHSKDEAKANDFYSDIFGWKVDTNNPQGYGMVDTGVEGAIPGGIAGPAMGPPMVTFYISVDDLDATLARVEEKGGKKLMGPDAIEGGPTIAMFSDLDGNVVGLVKGR